MLGGGETAKAVPLQYLNDESWQVSIELPPLRANEQISYDYILRIADGSFVRDWGRDRALLPIAFRCDELLVIDSWNDPGASENAFYTEPFKAVLLKANHTEVQSPAPPAATHTFRVKAPLLAKGQTLCLLGDSAASHWYYKAKLAALLALIGQEQANNVLDIGAGTGFFARQLHAKTGF